MTGGFENSPESNFLGFSTAPNVGHAFVYVCTIERMAINVLGRDAIFGVGDEAFDTDVDRLEIPIHAFDLIVADECQRGYTSAEVSAWRGTLDHFDAIKIGLTATPAKHTTGYFGAPVFHYSYEQAVGEGHLVDYDLISIRSDVRMTGVFLKEGEQVERVDPETVRVDGPQLRHFRLFCLLERHGAAVGLAGSGIVILAGKSKPFRTEFSDEDYKKVRAVGDEYIALHKLKPGGAAPATRAGKDETNTQDCDPIGT